MKTSIKAMIGAALAALVLTGCTATTSNLGRSNLNSYGPIADAGFKIPKIPLKKISPKYRRQLVDYKTRYRPGTIIVNTKTKHLYLVQKGGKAMRYGVGVGKQGFAWSGVAKVGWKRAWPTWTPPAAMIRRKPKLAKYRNGQEPGLNNPLGARALYLTKGGRDTLYRLHGTPQWWTIGTNASSGCIRLMNHDIIDLYNRVRPGARVIVKHG